MNLCTHDSGDASSHALSETQDQDRHVASKMAKVASKVPAL